MTGVILLKVIAAQAACEFASAGFLVWLLDAWYSCLRSCFSGAKHCCARTEVGTSPLKGPESLCHADNGIGRAFELGLCNPRGLHDECNGVLRAS